MNMNTTKVCTKCNIEKPISEFYKDAGLTDKHRNDCKACNKEKVKKWSLRNPEKKALGRSKWKKDNPKKYTGAQRKYHKKYMKTAAYKLTTRTTNLKRYWPECTGKEALLKYNELFSYQEGCCAICSRHQSELKQALAVDHEHETGQTRGLLCINCNFIVGHAKENIGILNAVIDYLSKYK